jgi:hypothetical protein
MDKPSMELGAPPLLAPPIFKSISGRHYCYFVSNAGVQFSDVTNGDTQYEANIDAYLPLLQPKLTKAGKIAVRQPHVPTQSAKWWTAQCEFRGLSVDGTVRDLQDRIRGHGDGGLSKTMKEAREKMKRAYTKDNNCAVEELWVRADKNEKAKIWLKRLLYESLVVQSGSGDETLMLEVDYWSNNIEKVSREMKFVCEMREMPDYKTGRRVVVVGLNAQSVRSKMAKVDHDIQRSILRARQEQELKEQEAQVGFDRRFSLAQSKGKRSKNEWNVGGEWEIRCPYMEEQWGSGHDGCSLKIGFTKPTETGLVQMYASFDFIAITGIMRFINPSAPDDDEEKDGNSSSNEEDRDDESEHSCDHGPKLAQFLFPKESLPSSSAREFKFRWRGEETGESEIQLYSDQALCSMTFESPNALTGIFISDLTGEVEFTGIRQGFETETKGHQREGGRAAMDRLDPSCEWSSRNEAAYERARVGRW